MARHQLNQSRITISEFPVLKSGPNLCIYVRLILKVVMYGYSDQVLNFFVRSYCVCTPLGFITKCFLIFIVDEVKNFATNNICSSCWSQSRTWIHAKGQSQIGGLCIKGKKCYYKIKSNQVLEQRFNCKLVFRDSQGSW